MELSKLDELPEFVVLGKICDSGDIYRSSLVVGLVVEVQKM